MNKPPLVDPRLFERLTPLLYDRKVQIESATEIMDPTNQPIRSWAPAAGLPEYLDCRRGVMTAALAQSLEIRNADMTISRDTEYIALPQYWPQIQKEMRANIIDGQVWNISGVLFDSIRHQTYLVVERETADADTGIAE